MRVVQNQNHAMDTVHEDFVRIASRISRRFGRAIETVGPLTRLGPHRSPLATYLARVVVGQQLSTTAARTIWDRLRHAAAAAGQSLPGYAAKAPPEILRACGVSANKVRTLCALAAAEAEGTIGAARLRALAPTARYEALVSLHGVGPWTAQMAALFWFREPDVWPADDASVRKTFSAFLAEQTRWSFTAAATLFAPRRSLLARYLWQIADSVPG